MTRLRPILTQMTWKLAMVELPWDLARRQPPSVGSVRHSWPVTGTDLLAPYGRNERCWCGSQRKYKQCHGNQRPPSLRGAPLPPDLEDSKYLSPSTSVSTNALTGMLPAGTGFYMPPEGPTPRSISYTNLEANLGAALSGEASDGAIQLQSLGRLRVEVLRRLAGLANSDAPPTDDVLNAVYQLTGHTICTVAELAKERPRRTILWNQELDLAQFLGRTLLLADHVLFPDRVFDTILRNATCRDLRQAAHRQLMNKELLEAGIALPVPPGVALAAHGKVALDLTADDLKRTALVSWVRSQLIVEGPTAREALFVTAADELSSEIANFWLYGRILPESLDDESRSFTTAMLQPYDPSHDYEPWINQVKDSAVGALVQRTNERVVTADIYGSEYVSASLFEARLLRTRESDERIVPAQAALWADIPELTDLTSPDLTKLLRNENAVEDLRTQVRAALATARTDIENIDAITDLSHQLDAASKKLERTADTDFAWQAVIPGGLSGASMVMGGITGGLMGLSAGAIGGLATLAPYLGSRLNKRRDAAYLFVAARRSRR